jgi:UDP-N-acetylmuramoyl-tripeptide--D-alanyl-D-alanine ligase
VEDTRRALGRLGAAHRRISRCRSSPCRVERKTTTKELIAAVLRQKPTALERSQFQHDIGVPLTLLRLESKHEAAVLEVGTNHPGELAPLVRLIEPRYGVDHAY